MIKDHYSPIINSAKSGLINQDLSQVDLANLNLDYVLFDYAHLNQANLEGTSLTQTSFFHANLVRAKLSGAMVYNCDFRYANLVQAQLNGVDFSTCDVRGAIFTDAQGLSLEQKRWLKANGALNIELEELQYKSWRRFPFLKKQNYYY